jgi:hypothetical protein
MAVTGLNCPVATTPQAITLCVSVHIEITGQRQSRGRLSCRQDVESSPKPELANKYGRAVNRRPVLAYPVVRPFHLERVRTDGKIDGVAVQRS